MFHTFFSCIHFTSTQGKQEKHTETFEMGPATLMETRNGTSDDFTNLILTGGPAGVTGDSSPSPPADQYAESGHYTAFSFFFFLKRVHNRYVIIFHLLALLNTLIIIPPPSLHRGSRSHPQT